VRDQAGETLVETLLSLVILGVAIVAIVGGLGQSIFSSSLHRDQSDGGTVLVASAESVKDVALNPYVNCATTASYSPTVGNTVPSGWAVSVQSVQYWLGDAAATTWGSTCRDLTTAVHVQKVTVNTVSPRGISHTLSVVKRGA
jgi:type II secretory pathway pseudopilin PulG